VCIGAPYRFRHSDTLGRSRGQVGHNRGVLSLVCFALGGLLGWGTARGGDTVQRVWPVVLRVQILVTSATLSLVASWRLTSASELLGPLALAAGFWLLLGATVLTRGRRSPGTSALESWAVSPNVIVSGWSAVCVHLMRRDAPFRQRRATSWVDQSPLLASIVGLLLHLVDAAPTWTADILTWAGPLLAFSGAALFTGSVIHPHNLAVRHTEHALRRWTRLTVVRVAYYLVVALAALAASSTPIAIVAVLSGLSAPAFQPVQLAVLYGYRSEIVVAAVRWGWLLAPFGLVAAAILR